MEQHLRDHGGVRPVVAGKYGEMNEAALDLAHDFAFKIAAKEFLKLTAAAGVRTPEEATSVVKREIVQSWGCCTVKARAQCLLKLLDYVGPEVDVLRSQERRHDLLRRGLLENEFNRNPSARVSGRPGGRP